ncbi:hypothetical protein ABK818_25630, partial [Escherichia coli]
FVVGGPVGDSELLLCHGMVCVVGRMRDLILQLSKSSIYSTKPDKGYDGVIAELCRAGRRCCRISSPCSAEKPKAAPMVISNDEVLHLTNKVQSLSKKSAGNRPANTSSLMNYIKSLSGNTKGMALYGRVKEELIRRGVIAVYEKTVVWR